MRIRRLIDYNEQAQGDGQKGLSVFDERHKVTT